MTRSALRDFSLSMPRLSLKEGLGEQRSLVPVEDVELGRLPQQAKAVRGSVASGTSGPEEDFGCISLRFMTFHGPNASF